MSPRVLLFTLYDFLIPSLSSAGTAVLTSSPSKNVYLRVNESMVSPSGNFVLVMQADGNLVIYKSNCIGNPSCAIWNSQTPQQQGEYFLAIQGDGNLVIYRGTPENNKGVVWHSQSHGALGNYFLALQDDNNLVVYRGTGPLDNQGAIWSTQTGLLNVGSSQTDGKVQLGWMKLTPCSTIEWRNIYNSTAKKAEQRLYGYAYVNQAILNKAKTDIEQCLVQAAGACGIASITASPAACLPSFKVALTACLSNRNVEQSVVNSVHLGFESQCMW